MLLPRSARIKAPPLKSQGIKTKVLPLIMSSIRWDGHGRWIEPFVGSGSVVFNVQPDKALLTDSNIHIINLYQSIKLKKITPFLTKRHLENEGRLLLSRGEDRYYEIRERFNRDGDPLDFLFLNRSCFNGIMRFNKKGKFNVPFCRKPERFRQAYVTKICNQVLWLQTIMEGRDWIFEASDWKRTVDSSGPEDFMYVDPPYIGRHTDYYNNWSENEADELARALHQTKAGFGYSMWLENRYRRNGHIEQWFAEFPIFTIEHFYHVGPTESLRNSMQEALIVSHKNAVDQLESLKLVKDFRIVDEDEDLDQVQPAFI